MPRRPAGRSSIFGRAVDDGGDRPAEGVVAHGGPQRRRTESLVRSAPQGHAEQRVQQGGDDRGGAGAVEAGLGAEDFGQFERCRVERHFDRGRHEPEQQGPGARTEQVVPAEQIQRRLGADRLPGREAGALLDGRR